MTLRRDDRTQSRSASPLYCADEAHGRSKLATTLIVSAMTAMPKM
jgi:hypothetical protein